MECKNCPFSLNCYAERFGLYPNCFTYLCPQCSRLIYTLRKQPKYIVYTFFCAKYNMKDFVKMHKERIANGVRNNIMQHYPYISKCSKCSNDTAILANVTWLELE